MFGTLNILYVGSILIFWPEMCHLRSRSELMNIFVRLIAYRLPPPQLTCDVMDMTLTNLLIK